MNSDLLFGERKLRNILLMAVLFFSLISCEDPSSLPNPSNPYMNWLSKNIHDYTIDQVRYCFCRDGGQAVKITVRSDTVYSVVRISDFTIIQHPDSKLYLSINDLFGIIKKSKNDSLIIKYEPQYGYPDTLDINPQLHPVDGGMIYLTSNLQIIK